MPECTPLHAEPGRMQRTSNRKSPEKITSFVEIHRVSTGRHVRALRVRESAATFRLGTGFRGLVEKDTESVAVDSIEEAATLGLQNGKRWVRIPRETLPFNNIARFRARLQLT